MHPLQSTLDAIAWPADEVRRVWLRLVGRVARPALVDRDLRVAVGATFAVAVTLVAVIVAPVWMLVLGPVVWGVPHLLADVRYLVARPGLHRRPWVALAIGVPVAVVGITALGVRVGLTAALGALLVARASPWRRLTLAIPTVALWGAALRWPREADLVFAHLHNLVAVGLWWAWRPRTHRWHWVPLAAFIAAAVFILAGPAEAWVRGLDAWHVPAARVQLGTFLLALAPFPTHLDLARRLLLLFAFAQSLHYAIWLRVIPDEARAAHTPRSFRQSFRVLLRDVGPAVLLLAMGLSVFFLVRAWIDMAVARDLYRRLAVFHGHLELGALALLWAERRRP